MTGEGKGLPFDPDGVADRLAEVRYRISSAGGDEEQVRVVAVTKTFGPQACAATLAAGLIDLGENYADELVGKAHLVELADPVARPRWHFLGAIQRNKMPRLAPLVAVYEGVDRLAEGAAIARLCPGATVLVEVATAPSPTRPGVAPQEVPALVEGLLGLGLVVDGLMTVAPLVGPDDAHRAFRTVRGLVDRLGLTEASMGMSDDLEVAVAEGATAVRVGRALFGPRHAR